jgi:hypothetical protein
MKLQSSFLNDTGEKAHSPNPGARNNVLVVPSSVHLSGQKSTGGYKSVQRNKNI